jgi:hypothetical protein
MEQRVVLMGANGFIDIKKVSRELVRRDPAEGMRNLTDALRKFMEMKNARFKSPSVHTIVSPFGTIDILARTPVKKREKLLVSVVVSNSVDPAQQRKFCSVSIYLPNRDPIQAGSDTGRVEAGLVEMFRVLKRTVSNGGRARPGGNGSGEIDLNKPSRTGELRMTFRDPCDA